MPPFSPADERDDEQQRLRPPWLPDGVPAEGDHDLSQDLLQTKAEALKAQGLDAYHLTDPDRPSFGDRIGAKDTPALQPIPPNRT
jgi:hypothetical protein